MPVNYLSAAKHIDRYRQQTFFERNMREFDAALKIREKLGWSYCRYVLSISLHPKQQVEIELKG